MKSISKLTRESGQSLIEVIVAIFVFVLGIASVGMLVLDANVTSRQGIERTKAVFLAEEGLEAARSMRNASFAGLAAGTHGVTTTPGMWVFSGASDEADQFTRTVKVEDIDAMQKKVTADVTWPFLPLRPGSVSLVTYLANIFTKFWSQTNVSDFNGGRRNSVEAANVSGGEVRPVSLGDFSNAQTLRIINAASTGAVRDIAISGDTAYAVRASSAGAEFLALDISDVSSSTPAQIGSVEIGAAVNGIAISGGYAYIATADNARELIVIRLSDYSIVNSFDTPTGADALHVAISGTSAYVVTGNSSAQEFYKLDAASPEGAITQISETEIGGDVSGIAVSGGYAFLATGHNTRELAVVRISDGVLVNSLNLSGTADMSGIAVSGSRAYLSRLSSADPEVYAVDTGAPEGPLSAANSLNLGGSANAVFTSGNGRLYVAGSDNTKELSVIDTASFAETGFANLATNNDALAVSFYGGYAYLGTANGSAELTVVSGGNSALTERVREGWFISSAFDSLDTGTVWGDISWTKTGTGTLQLQIRTAAAFAGLSNAAWVGPDGTAGTFYATASGTAVTVDPGAAGTRWIQYKAYFSGNGTDIPVLEDVGMTYN
jgi:Tfp pilus assembly protein PilV